jgi:ubiquinone/menaquinone biosynthesis C-methylase UbiE
MPDVTQILQLIEDCDAQAAEKLLPLLYEELKKLAAVRMAAERADHTLQATALVHEAYLRLVGASNGENWNSRGHFFAAAAEPMRRILVESARRKQRIAISGAAGRKLFGSTAPFPYLEKTTMSQFADYAVASDDYDSTRVPIGVDAILRCFARTDVPPREQTVLEAGCGTGNYLQALRPQVGSLFGIDFSDGMLAQARAKLGEDVELTCGSILEMSYEDGKFDGITCNQVLHHLDEGPSPADDPAEWKASGSPNVTRFINEAYRVLKPGGAFVLNTTTHEQLLDGYWWADLIPTAMVRLSCRMPDLDPLTQILAAAGFEIELIEADLDGILQGASYLNPTGPLNEAWRAGDSTWSLATETELTAAGERVEGMNLDGTMEAWLEAREEKRRSLGQSTFICSRKV